MATDADTQEAARRIQEQLAAHKIASELGPLLGGAQELARELAGPKGQGRHIGGEGLNGMHRYAPSELLTLALLSRTVSALEDIAASLGEVSSLVARAKGSSFEDIATSFERMARTARELAKDSTSGTAAPPPATPDTSNAATAAGAPVPPAPAAVDAPSQG